MNLQQQDLQCIWHPYTHQKNILPPIPIIKGKGTLLIDEAGNSYIDAISSWWVNIHGHAHPYIAEQIYEQAKKLEHVIFTGFTHEPAVTLAASLLPLLPGSFSKVFYSDNGSTATEVAIKMCLQYWSNRNEEKRKILAFNHSYHGDTFGAMSISNRSIFNAAFEDKLFDVLFIDTPTKENLSGLKSFINAYQDIACFIYEPLLQGAGGMLMHEAEYLDELLLYVKAQNILCIADEVLTGFYRTGTFFASDQLQQKADVICLSKALTGGTMALGITATTENIYNAFVSDDKSKTFFHGHSFTANPLACTTALASLHLLQKEECIQSIQKICLMQQAFLSVIATGEMSTRTRNHRSCGTIIAFEVLTGNADNYLNSLSERCTAYCLQSGVYLRPLGNTIYIMPPYCITEKELKRTHEVILSFLSTE